MVKLEIAVNALISIMYRLLILKSAYLVSKTVHHAKLYQDSAYNVFKEPMCLQTQKYVEFVKKIVSHVKVLTVNAFLVNLVNMLC